MSDSPPDPAHATPDEMAAFATRLAEWGKSLPASERVLVQALIERARELDLDIALRTETTTSIDKAIRDAITAINRRWDSTDGGVWVKALDPTWLRRTPNSVYGDEIEILQRLRTREVE